MSITINEQPQANRIVLDSNNTNISVTSSNGIGYYFRALIYINDELFDTQAWSRIDSFTANKNLKKLYNAYFETIFNETFVPGLTEQTHLKAKVDITIKEYALADDTEVQSETFNTFYILYNQNPVSFSDENKIQLLGIEPDILRISDKGKIVIPFYVNATDEEITVVLKDSFGTTLQTLSVVAFTGKKVYLYQFDSAYFSVAANTLYFQCTLSVGSNSIVKNIRIFQISDYPIKEIAVLNNFGFYQYVYLDGIMNIDDAFDINSFTQENGTEKIFEINEEQTYSINSGTFVSSEKAILKTIANALDAKMFWKNEWLTLVTNTKKVKEYQDKQTGYSENLIFKVQRSNSIDNTFGEEIFVPTLILEDVLLTLTGNNVGFYFTCNVPLSNLSFENNPPTDWSTAIALDGTSSPQVGHISTIGFTTGKVRLKTVYLGSTIYSNELTI